VEEVVIKTLKDSCDVTGSRSSINSGVWIGNNKISAVGISASRWITYHGSSLNVNCEMSFYQNIIPCGIPSSLGGVTRLADVLSDLTGIENDKKKSLVKAEDLVPSLLNSLSQVFHVDCQLEEITERKQLANFLDSSCSSTIEQLQLE
jgi:lipoate-protein ligase B